MTQKDVIGEFEHLSGEIRDMIQALVEERDSIRRSLVEKQEYVDRLEASNNKLKEQVREAESRLTNIADAIDPKRKERGA